jgi:bifunctional UDP-N-acetylglucosamine pyrophosphorylase / glucosamine-1-phosphate N-acetyltransferase
MNDELPSQDVAAIVFASHLDAESANPQIGILRSVCGRPMIHYVLEAAIAAGATRVVVVVSAHQEGLGLQLNQSFGTLSRIVVQDAHDGCRAALQRALEILSAARTVFVLPADAVFLDSEMLSTLNAKTRGQAEATVLAGQIHPELRVRRVRRDNQGKVLRIGRADDADPSSSTVDEIDLAVYCCTSALLVDAVERSGAAFHPETFDVADVVARAAQREAAIAVPVRIDPRFLTASTRCRLDAIDDALFARIADRHRDAGVIVHGTPRIDATVTIEPKAMVEHGAVLRGKTHVGAGAYVDVGAILIDATIAPGAIIRPYSICDDSSIGECAVVGPLSHVRGASQIHAHARVGNFVETKNVIMRRGAMANHLAYLGDGDVGEKANIGAGTIFCNSDGINKYRTEVGAGAFVGSDCQLVAPVTVGDGAFVATGTTVTRDVPADALAIAREPQTNKEGYAKLLRARFQAEKQRRDGR